MSPPPADWLPRSAVVDLLAGAFLLSALVAAARRRAADVVAACRVNAIALGLLALALAFATGAGRLALAAVLVLAGKAALVPALLARRARDNAHGDEAASGAPLRMLACAALAVLAYDRTRALPGLAPGLEATCLPVAAAVLLIGLFVLASRREPAARLAGLALAQHGVLLAAVSLAYDMPLVAALSVLQDVPLVASLVGPLAGRATPARAGAGAVPTARGAAASAAGDVAAASAEQEG